MKNRRMIKLIVSLTFAFAVAHSSLLGEVDNIKAQLLVREVGFSHIKMEGELYRRVCRNFDRLQEDKYQPQNVFLTEEESGNWPGDTEGRTILGLVLDAQASHREPFFLQRIIELIPSRLNEAGYMGLIYPDAINEQQLSGNGWMLRGLCEYYAWKKDEKVLAIIKSIVDNLFIKGKGYYSQYPINPDIRIQNAGKESGAIQNTHNQWMLSSDIGCVFIGMEGAIHAYKYYPTPQLKEVIEEMIQRFLEIDLIKIKAQTHASLTACRGLVRYADITGDKHYLKEVEKRWEIYMRNGMTENHENYNWFERFDTWTEPCAIIDSYMLAVQLWQRTGKPEYRNEAEKIYYNAIGHTQRFNGGFGCDNCPGEANKCLGIHAPEAHWCCTMRGGEGLSSAVKYAYMLNDKTLYVPFYQQSKFLYPVNETSAFSVEQETNYPFSNKIQFRIIENTAGIHCLKMPWLPWASDYKLELNGKRYEFKVDNGFIVLDRLFEKGDVVELIFNQEIFSLPAHYSKKQSKNKVRFYYGPLVLGLKDVTNPVELTVKDQIIPLGDMKFKIAHKDVILSPIYHLMDPAVWDLSYKNQILF